MRNLLIFIKQIKFWLNGISTREFVLLSISMTTLFIWIINSYINNIYSSKYIFLEMREKQQSFSSQKYDFLHKNADKILTKLHKDKELIKMKNSYIDNNISFKKTFKNSSEMLLWVCDKERRFFIDKITILAGDIKGDIDIIVNTNKQYLLPKKCLIIKNHKINMVFYYKKYTINSIISNMVKVNDKWLEANEYISNNIQIKIVNIDNITIDYNNSILNLHIGDVFN